MKTLKVAVIYLFRTYFVFVPAVPITMIPSSIF